MSDAGGSSSGRGGRGWLLGVALVAVIVSLALLAGKGPGERYDLDDAGPNGYKGLRLVLERFDTTVDRIDADELTAARAQASDGTDAAFVPVASNAGPGQMRQWEAFARAGGTLVLGLPSTSIAPGLDLSGIAIVAVPPDQCDVAGLEDLESIDPVGSFPIVVPSEAESCFGNGDRAFVVRRSVGEGEIITIASPDLFINDAMRPHDQEVDDPPSPMRDNVVLAQRLLGGDGEASRLAVVTSGVSAAVPTEGRKSLTELMGTGVKLGIVQLIAAFAFYAWWRGRRHGRVVRETQPVPIAGSELVDAVGNLMSRRDDPYHAAQLLRTEAARELGDRLGVPRGTDPRVLAAIISSRTGRDEHEVLGVLATTVVADDGVLVDVVNRLETIRTEILHGR